MKKLLKYLIPLLVLAASVVGAVAIIASKPEAEVHRPEILPPLIRVMAVQKQDIQLVVKSQGTVTPRTESRLVSEVSGRVIRVSPSFETGGFFQEQEVLLEIDDQDYRQALARAKAELAARRLQLAREEAEAEVARREWDDLGGDTTAPELTLRQPQLEDAKASLAAAEAALSQAERDLERCKLKAPYAGRVREKRVDVGEYISRGTAAAVLYAVDYAEIRLPLPDSELAYVDLPLDYWGEVSRREGPAVTIKADFAGKEHHWQGVLVRTEGEIDPLSRMVHVVARVKAPYARGEEPASPPLAVGLFVQADIHGKQVHDVAVLPRAALRGDDRVMVVDPEKRLWSRKVDLLRATRESIIVGQGLAEKEEICISPLEAFTEGMRVRTVSVPDDEGAET